MCVCVGKMMEGSLGRGIDLVIRRSSEQGHEGLVDMDSQEEVDAAAGELGVQFHTSDEAGRGLGLRGESDTRSGSRL